MRITHALPALAAGLVAASLAPVATAATTLVDEQVVVLPSSVPHPARGATMATVEAKFGAPATRHEAVGTPPITRWDYAGFSVYFEHQRVIETVVAAP